MRINLVSAIWVGAAVLCLALLDGNPAFSQ